MYSQWPIAQTSLSQNQHVVHRWYSVPGSRSLKGIDKFELTWVEGVASDEETAVEMYDDGPFPGMYIFGDEYPEINVLPVHSLVNRS